MAGPADVWLLDHAEIAGGGQGFGLRLAKALAAGGRRVRIGCRRDSALAHESDAAGIELVEIDFPSFVPWRAASIAVAIARLRRLLRGAGPEALVLGNHPRVHAYLYAATRGLGDSPVIVNLAHEQDSAGRASLRFVYGRFGALLVVGANATAEYSARLPGIPITSVNNFLAAEDFDRAGRLRGRARENRSELGVLARLIPEKGVRELVEELGSAEVRTSWSKLAIGGAAQDAEYTRRLEGRIAELGLDERVSLLGEVEDVAAFLGAIDTLVVPSTGNEGQPTVILEALAHGVPVVVRAPLHSSDFEGLPVRSYASTAELAAALRKPAPGPARIEDLVRRFGPEQAIAGVERAAQLASARS